MKIKLSQIIDSIGTLRELANKKFSSKTSFKIQRNMRLIEPELQGFESERKRLLEKYGEQLENGSFNIEQKDVEKVNIELAELLEEDFELDIKQIGIDELTYDITPNEMMKIEWMIDEDSI